MKDLIFEHLPVSEGSPITGGFGADYGSYLHRGVDFGVPTGTPVFAPAAGRVSPMSNDGSFGIAVCIDHLDTPWYSLYAHLSEAWVNEGQMVTAGQVIGLSGNTGMSTGPHLHWQVCRWNTFPRDISQSADPLSFMRVAAPPPPPAEEEPMTDDERAVIAELGRRLRRVEAIIGGNGIDVPGRGRLTEDDALEFLAADGASLALGQGALQAHTHNVADLGLTGRPNL